MRKGRLDVFTEGGIWWLEWREGRGWDEVQEAEG